MTPVATIVFSLGIFCLFWLDRDPRTRTSRALWIPVVWLSIAGSRSVSQWLQTTPMSGNPGHEGNSLDQFVAAALIAFGISVLVGRGSKVKTLLRANQPIVLFFLYCALSIVWSEYPDATVTRWAKALGDLLMILIVLTDPAPIAAVRRVLSRVSFVLLPLSILFIKYYPEWGRYYSFWEGRQYFSGVAVDKNMLGTICLACALPSTSYVIEAIWDGRRNRKTRALIAHSIVLWMALWLFLRLDSMTSLFCFLMATSLIAATRLPLVAQTASVRHALIALVLLFTSSVLFFDLGGSILGAMGRDSSLTGRIELWTALSAMNPSPMFGAGFEAFWRGPRIQQLAQTVGGSNEAHNGYLEVYLNLGWTGLTLLALIIAVGYRNISRAMRLDPQAGRLWLAYFVAGIVYSFTEAGFRLSSPIWITFLLAIVGSSATFTNTRDTRTAPSPTAPRRAGTRTTVAKAGNTSGARTR